MKILIKNITKTIIVTLLACSSLSNAGEIYQCRSDDGSMKFSDQPCVEQAQTGSTAAHSLWKEIDEISRTGSSMVSLRGATPELRKQCKVKMEKMNTRIENMKGRIAKLDPKYSMIVSAYNKLPQCISCGQAATYYCRESDMSLKAAANELHYRR